MLLLCTYLRRASEKCKRIQPRVQKVVEVFLKRIKQVRNDMFAKDFLEESGDRLLELKHLTPIAEDINACE